MSMGLCYEVYEAVDLQHPLSFEDCDICKIVKGGKLKNLKVVELKKNCKKICIDDCWKSAKKKAIHRRHKRVGEVLFLSPVGRCRCGTFIISYPSDTDGWESGRVSRKTLVSLTWLKSGYTSQCLRAQGVPKGNLPFFRLFVFS